MTREESRANLRDELTGALVGLARTARRHEAPPSADKAVLAGLRALKNPMAQAEELQGLVEEVHAAKLDTAPDCAACRNPCGHNDDFDLHQWVEDDPAVRGMKLNLLHLLETVAFTEDAALCPVLYEGLRALGDEWDVTGLRALMARVREAMMKTSQTAVDE